MTERYKMIDLHVHILPGMDDGADTMDESMEMAELALDSGVEALVVTPHSNQKGRFESYMSPELIQVYKEFCYKLDREQIPLKIYFGMEIFASDDMAAKIKNRQLVGLNAGDTYLIEFPFDAEPEWIGERLEDVLDLKKRPLIAHPERYFCVQDYPELVYEWVRMGCLSQLNKGSMLGRFGRNVQRAANILLDNGLVSCVASDAHSSFRRTTYMADACDYLESRYSVEYARLLLRENPRRILSGAGISPHGRIPERRRRFFW